MVERGKAKQAGFGTVWCGQVRIWRGQDKQARKGEVSTWYGLAWPGLVEQAWLRVARSGMVSHGGAERSVAEQAEPNLAECGMA